MKSAQPDKAICLLSGGIDSPVASALMMQAGYEVILVHFFNFTNARSIVKDKVMKIANALTKFQSPLKLYLIPFDVVQKELIGIVPSRLRMIIYRRMMFRIGEEIMKKEKASAFITGDSLGQVASQTLQNITTIYSVTKKPILTPLLGLDKQEIVDKAKQMGTYGLSILPYADCCSFLIAKHPETRAKKEVIKKVEEHLDMASLVRKAMRQAEMREIK